MLRTETETQEFAVDIITGGKAEIKIKNLMLLGRWCSVVKGFEFSELGKNVIHGGTQVVK